MRENEQILNDKENISMGDQCLMLWGKIFVTKV